MVSSVIRYFLRTRRACATLLLVLLFVPLDLFAQGGPPLVTDDPGTPGDGKWEINLATLGSHTLRRWDVDVFDADINYGVGDHIQLKADVPWAAAHVAGQGWRSGLGAANLGVKWRFVDQDESGFDMSTYPQYLSAWSSGAKRRGVASNDAQFYLPVEFAKTLGGYEFVAEAGRNFVEHESDQSEAGVVAAHDCGGEVECLAEVHRTWSPHDNQTLLNLGLHWKLSERSILLASAGREFGTASAERQRFVFYFGVQLLR
jgi:hypothetical protein